MLAAIMNITVCRVFVRIKCYSISRVYTKGLQCITRLVLADKDFLWPVGFTQFFYVQVKLH